jgi:hypothetical protein
LAAWRFPDKGFFWAETEPTNPRQDKYTNDSHILWNIQQTFCQNFAEFYAINPSFPPRKRQPEFVTTQRLEAP